jgi:hypothetical protein
MTEHKGYYLRFYSAGWMREWYGDWSNWARAKIAGEEIADYIGASSFHVIDDRGRAVYSARVSQTYCSAAPNTYCPKHEKVHVSPSWAAIREGK